MTVRLFTPPNFLKKGGQNTSPSSLQVEGHDSCNADLTKFDRYAMIIIEGIIPHIS